jgi:hypothetical protein
MGYESLSLPLDGGGRFGTEVIGYPGHARDLVDNTVGHFLQEVIGQS